MNIEAVSLRSIHFCDMSPVSFSYILWLVLAGVLFVSQCNGDPPLSGSRGPRRRFRPAGMRNVGGLRPELLALYNDALEDTTASPWSSFAPSAPSPEDVQCHVRVQQVVYHGGRCIRLGGRRVQYACQSGHHLRVQQSCDPQIVTQTQVPIIE